MVTVPWSEWPNDPSKFFFQQTSGMVFDQTISREGLNENGNSGAMA